jgi:hypothetical protein
MISPITTVLQDKQFIATTQVVGLVANTQEVVAKGSLECFGSSVLDSLDDLQA